MMSSSPARDPWKLSTLLLAALLALSLAGWAADAEAAGPVRLTKALAALKSCKKFLDEAKDPPAPYHAQSLTAVGQAIAAVEREIKAHEAKAKGAPSAAPPGKAPPKKEEKKPKKGPEGDDLTRGRGGPDRPARRRRRGGGARGRP